MIKFGALIEIVFYSEEVVSGDSGYKLEQILERIKQIPEIENAEINEGPDLLE